MTPESLIVETFRLTPAQKSARAILKRKSSAIQKKTDGIREPASVNRIAVAIKLKMY
jgi:hypothetical protein